MTFQPIPSSATTSTPQLQLFGHPFGTPFAQVMRPPPSRLQVVGLPPWPTITPGRPGRPSSVRGTVPPDQVALSIAMRVDKSVAANEDELTRIKSTLAEAQERADAAAEALVAMTGRAEAAEAQVEAARAAQAAAEAKEASALAESAARATAKAKKALQDGHQNALATMKNHYDGKVAQAVRTLMARTSRSHCSASRARETFKSSHVPAP